jgi:plastocyanin
MRPLIAAASLFLLASATPVAAAAPAPTYTIRLYSFGFQPEPIVLRAGVPVTLVFTNSAGLGHEFSARAFFSSARILSGNVGSDGSVELKPHQSASVTLIPVRGAYEAHCGHFMHKQLGMSTWVYVE